MYLSCDGPQPLKHVTPTSGNFYPTFCRLLIFLKLTFSKNSFRDAIRVSNSLDRGRAGHSAVRSKTVVLLLFPY